MIGIVILNYETYVKTIECVDSILNTYHEKINIYIVDNKSLNDSFEILSKKYKLYSFIKVIQATSNEGFARGNNLGLKECQKDGCTYVILSNNDILYCDNSIEYMKKFIIDNKDAVIVGPKLYKPNMEIQRSTTLKKMSLLDFFGLAQVLPSHSKSTILDEENLKEAVEVYSVSGCCFIVNLQRFFEIGAFDEGTFLYNEENILSMQVSLSPYKTYFLPISKIIHSHGATTGKQNMFVNGELLKSGLYYWKKYRKCHNFILISIWGYFTLRWLLKATYSKELRSGWLNYIRTSLKALYSEILSKYPSL